MTLPLLCQKVETVFFHHFKLKKYSILNGEYLIQNEKYLFWSGKHLTWDEKPSHTMQTRAYLFVNHNNKKRFILTISTKGSNLRCVNDLIFPVENFNKVRGATL